MTFETKRKQLQFATINLKNNELESTIKTLKS
jgi:hypothetical protein